jgi:hypothetical protein
MSDVQVEQSWWQATDGKWYPPERHPNFRPTGIPASGTPQSGMPPSGFPPLPNVGSPALPNGRSATTHTFDNAPTYRWAAVVATVFKVAAWLVLIGGVIGAISTYDHLHSIGASNPFDAAVGVAVGAILGASAFAFFGYVLDLLRASVLEARIR